VVFPMKKRKIRIQCRCRACGRIWMDRRQLEICEDCEGKRMRRLKNGNIGY
jgi:rRNA maturation endonuclease Nob1